MNKKEINLYLNFVTEHKYCYKTGKKQKFHITYEPTGIGIGVSVKCKKCKTNLCITDFDSW